MRSSLALVFFLVVACGSDSEGSAPGADAGSDSGSGGTGATGTGATGGTGGTDAASGGSAGSPGGAGGSAGADGGAAGSAGSGGQAGSDAGVATPCTAADNVLDNPSFESITSGTPDGWAHVAGDPGTVASTTPTFAVDGPSVMELATPNPAPQSQLSYSARFAGPTFDVTSGMVVSGHFYAKVSDWGLNGYWPVLGFEMLDSGGNVIEETATVPTAYQAGNMVQQAMPMVTVPNTAATARVVIRLRFDTVVSYDAMCVRIAPP